MSTKLWLPRRPSVQTRTHPCASCVATYRKRGLATSCAAMIDWVSALKRYAPWVPLQCGSPTFPIHHCAPDVLLRKRSTAVRGHPNRLPPVVCRKWSSLPPRNPNDESNPRPTGVIHCISQPRCPAATQQSSHTRMGMHEVSSAASPELLLRFQAHICRLGGSHIPLVLVWPESCSFRR